MSIRRGISPLGLVLIAAMLTPAQQATGDVPVYSPFVVYDNMFFRGKPDTTSAGLVLSNILYEGSIWPHRAGEGKLPKRSTYEALVRSHSVNPGPFVIDIELLPLKGADAQRNMKTLATLADWARQAVPGKAVGFYRSGTLTRVPHADLALARELATHVDAFFPPMYTFDDDRVKWAQRAKQEADEAHDMGAGKPVYFYLWPQYHDNTPKQFQWVDSAYWTLQLETSRKYANGIVIWGSSKYAWDTSTGWWTATQAFMRAKLPPPGARY